MLVEPALLMASIAASALSRSRPISVGGQIEVRFVAVEHDREPVALAKLADDLAEALRTR
jgi:hypothetical protein